MAWIMENRGRLLENVVAVELFRRRRRAFYYKGTNECDFVIQEGTRVVEAWQVCWELTPSNEKRELAGLAEAMRELGVPRGGILTYAQEGTRKIEGKTMPILPVWKWLLNAAV